MYDNSKKLSDQYLGSVSISMKDVVSKSRTIKGTKYNVKFDNDLQDYVLEK